MRQHRAVTAKMLRHRTIMRAGSSAQPAMPGPRGVARPRIIGLTISIDPWIALGPVIAAARDQPHAIAVALDPQAVAVVLDLVEPIRAARDLDAASGNAELKRLKHAPDIGA